MERRILISASIRTGFWLCVLGLAPVAAHADWQAVETIKPYAISGRTAPELYASIGARGPLLGGGRVIAHTAFKLTWTRNYQPQASSCVLVSAVPKLTIIYTLPKPSSPLPPAVDAKWQTFIAGVAAHEKVHGGFIRDMVHEIETLSIGFTVANDPDCSQIRIALTKRLGEISARERQRNRDFDRVEMGPGGNVQQLILALVND
jgi:predicted secreted Zn-dependent protease